VGSGSVIPIREKTSSLAAAVTDGSTGAENVGVTGSATGVAGSEASVGITGADAGVSVLLAQAVKTLRRNKIATTLLIRILLLLLEGD